MKVWIKILDRPKTSWFSLWGATLVMVVAGFGCDRQSNTSNSIPTESSRSAGANDWSGFLGPGQDGFSSVKGIRTDWANDALPVLWTRDLGQGYAPGVLVGDRYFHFDRTRQEARLVCLNSSSGEEIWQFKYPCNYRDTYGYDGGPRSCPVVADNDVFIYGPEGMLHCIDVNGGEVKWKQNLSERFAVHQNFFGVGSPPVVLEDKLLVMVGGSPEDNQIPGGAIDQALPNGSAIVALDRKTGDELYRLGDDLASYTAIKVVEFEGRHWAFAWLRGSLIAFDPDNGKIDFEFPWRARLFESVNASTPVVFDGHVFLSECYGVGSVLLKFGNEIPEKHRVVWQDEGREKSLMTHWNTPIYFEGYLYASSGRHTRGATLRCIDAMTGEVKWSKDGFGRSSMTWVDGKLAVQAERGELFLLNANPERFDLVTTYEPGDMQKNQVRLNYPCWAAPVIANGKMFVRGKNQLICFELKEVP